MDTFIRWRYFICIERAVSTVDMHKKGNWERTFLIRALKNKPKDRFYLVVMPPLIKGEVPPMYKELHEAITHREAHRSQSTTPRYTGLRYDPAPPTKRKRTS